MKNNNTIKNIILSSITLVYMATSCTPAPVTHDVCIEFNKETAYCTSNYNWPTVFVASGDSEMNIQTIANTADETWWGQTYTHLSMYGMSATSGKVAQIPVVQDASFTLIVEFDENSCTPSTPGCWIWYYQADYPVVEEPIPCTLSALHSIDFASNQPMAGGCI
jgi:hypothetical protein